MLSRRILTASRLLRTVGAPQTRFYPIPVVQQFRTYADKIVKVPEMAESISEGTLKQFSKQIGDFVEQDEEIATIETDKIDVAVNAPEAGTIKEFLANEEDTVTVGQDLVRIELGGAPEGGKEEKASSEPKEPAAKEQPTSSDPKPAKEEDSKPAEEKKPAPEEKKPAPKKEAAPQPPKQEQSKKAEGSSSASPLGNREERRVKMNRMRLRIAERLKQSQNTAASLTTFNKIDMSSLMDFRKKYKDQVLKDTGVKLGFMSAFSRACVLAMRDIPAVNASIEGPNGGDTIVYRDYVDISVAVATEKGLVTPVVRNTETMDMIGIEKSIADLGKKVSLKERLVEGQKADLKPFALDHKAGEDSEYLESCCGSYEATLLLARDGKLTIEDMAGGTFTISNGGVFGSLMGTPIINLPQTAVLGLHAINDEAVVVNGQIVVRPIMYVALTYDHRLLDGREAVQFLVKIKQYIEDPRRMLL